MGPISAIGTNLRKIPLLLRCHCMCYARSNEDVLDVYSSTHKCSNFGLIINFCFAIFFIFYGSLLCCIFIPEKKNPNYDVMNKTICMITPSLLVLFSYSNYKLYN